MPVDGRAGGGGRPSGLGSLQGDAIFGSGVGLNSSATM